MLLWQIRIALELMDPIRYKLFEVFFSVLHVDQNHSFLSPKYLIINFEA